MSKRVDVYTVDVSEKTTWIWFRLTGAGGQQGVGEATLNNRADEVLAAVGPVLEAVSACDLGVAAKLGAVRQCVPGIVGRAIASALEQASLDVEGQRVGLPVHALLGGRYRSSVPCYANINRGTLTRQPAEFAERAEAATEDSYGAVKLAPFDGVTPDALDDAQRRELIEGGIARVAAVVRRLEGRGRVQVDCHSRFRPEEAVAILARLAALGVSWFEEPMRESEAALPAIAALRAKARAYDVVLAGAEQAAGLGQFEPYCHAGCYDVIMPDIILAGGPSEVVRIGYLAAAVGQAISLHNPCGPVMDMHSAHVAAAVPELHSLERQFRESDLYDGLVQRRHRFEGGSYHFADCPGLGLSVNWDAVEVRQRFSGEVRM